MDTPEAGADRLVQALAAQLRAERVAAGMTFDELAAASGVSRRALITYLNGERTGAMPARTLADVARALGLTPGALWQRASERA